jgi:hypothetical protein
VLLAEQTPERNIQVEIQILMTAGKGKAIQKGKGGGGFTIRFSTKSQAGEEVEFFPR